MGLRINSNILSLQAQRYLSNTTRAFGRALARLSSGSRINSAGDDAAGLSIAGGLDAQRRGLLRAIRNINDAQGFLNTADSTIAVQMDLLQRMRAIAVQAANGTYSDDHRSYLDSEFQALLLEVDRLGSQTQFNGVNMLDGSFGTKSIQVGSSKNQTVNISMQSTRINDIFTLTSDETPSTVGSGTFATRTTTSGSSPLGIDSGDVNGDGFMDIVTSADFNNAPARVHLGNGNGTFAASVALAASGLSGAVKFADVNGDSLLDVVLNNGTAGTVSVFIGNGNGTFTTATTFQTGSNPASLDTADLNGDGFIDIIAQDQGSGTLSILLGNGNGTFATRTTISASNSSGYPGSLEIADLNNDNSPDLILTARDFNRIGVFIGNGNGTFQAQTTLQVSGTSNPAAPAVGDINGDGYLDIVSAESSSTFIGFYLGNGNGTFVAPTTTTGLNARDIEMADMNGDGYLDIIVVGSTLAGYLAGNGNGTFTPIVTMTTGLNTTYSVTINDFNDDGVYDFATANRSDNTWSLHLQNTTTSGTTLTISDVNVLTQSSAEDTLEFIDGALETLYSRRTDLGASMNRLSYAEQNNLSLVQNLASARSQIIDADLASDMAEFARLQILQQAGLAVLSQANTQTKLTLDLLKSL